MSLTRVQHQDLAYRTRQVFCLLQKIQQEAIDGFSSALRFNQAFHALDSGLVRAAELANGDEFLNVKLLAFRGALLALCGMESVTGPGCYLRHRNDPKGLDEAVRAANEKARDLGLLDLNARASPGVDEAQSVQHSRKEEQILEAAGCPDKEQCMPSVNGSQTRCAPSTELSPCLKRIHSLYIQAIDKEPVLETITDREVYEYVRENLLEKGEPPLPSVETFCRYLREVRAALGKQKNQRRRGREGRSVIRPDQK